MDYSKNAELVRLVKNGDEKALEELVISNGGLVKSIALRFTGRGTELEDLIQLGTIGFIKAVKSYDESYNTVLSTYAVPLIMGEIRRFLRDDGMIKVSREAKQNYAKLKRTKELLTAQNGTEPTVKELAEACQMTVDDAVYAISAGNCVLSLDTPKNEGDAELADFIGSDDTDRAIEYITLHAAVEKLPENQQKIIALRYKKGLSQTKTAQILGLSQVKVSREEQKIYARLKEMIS